jgi:hypothetical protein
MLYTRFQIGHLEVVVHNIDKEVGEPRGLLSGGLHEKLVEQGERLLAEGVTPEKFE